MSHARVPPHPAICQRYQDDPGKSLYLQRLFDETAVDYDRVERVMALGSGPRYRQQALRRAGIGDGARVLDVAMGTGLVARAAAALIGPSGRVIGIDPSIGMLQQALSDPNFAAAAVMGRGEALPIADGVFDFVTLGYALRHLSDLRVAFDEFRRVLRPGGRVCVLEITRPRGIVQRGLIRTYFRGVLPVLARAVGSAPRTGELWEYYWETIQRCVPPEVVLKAMNDAGFTDVKRHVALGIFSEYTATRP